MIMTDKRKSQNEVLNYERAVARGIQILTWNECARANDIGVGAYEVVNKGEDVDDYAKGRRVNIKFYIDDVRFQKQLNEGLTEVTVYMKVEEFEKITDLELSKESSIGEDSSQESDNSNGGKDFNFKTIKSREVEEGE